MPSRRRRKSGADRRGGGFSPRRAIWGRAEQRLGDTRPVTSELHTARMAALVALVRRGAQLGLPRVHEVESGVDEVVLRLGERAPLTVDLQLGQPDFHAGLLGEYLRREGEGRGQHLRDLGGVGNRDLGAGAPPDQMTIAAGQEGRVCWRPGAWFTRGAPCRPPRPTRTPATRSSSSCASGASSRGRDPEDVFRDFAAHDLRHFSRLVEAYAYCGLLPENDRVFSA